MSASSSLSGSPGAAPLQTLSSDRVNQQRDSSFSSVRTDHHRDSTVYDKISQFNHMAHLGPATAISMTKQLERKTADAALKRAMLGREEAESEMRRYREESRSLRKQIEEGRERERKVGERLETVMENYGRAKETYSHTQALWEKEIRRARKETFKSQSSIVKLQEDLKAVKIAHKSTEEVLEREKERSNAREQEAFTARYQIVGVQEQLEQALERVKLIEQERDAFKTLAKNEEVARIAAEGRLPLPADEDDAEFASPKKARVSLTTAEIKSSATSEAEIDELTRMWQWEKQRADRTTEHLEFLEAECELQCCPCAKTRPSRSTVIPTRRQRPEPVVIVDAADLAILGQASVSSRQPERAETPDDDTVVHVSPVEAIPLEDMLQETVVQKEPRRSTIFVPSEGIFRTLSQQDIEAMETVDESTLEPPTPVDPNPVPMHYARTPSVDPPSFALMARERTSLLSLLNAPRESEAHSAAISVPTTPANPPTMYADPEPENSDAELTMTADQPVPQSVEPRPHTSAAFYTVTNTSTVPIRDENIDPTTGVKFAAARAPSFDTNNPALTPTMTREQALAQIKERRGRARSAAQGTMTPRRQMVAGGPERRDVSAPAGRAVRGRS